MLSEQSISQMVLAYWQIGKRRVKEQGGNRQRFLKIYPFSYQKDLEKGLTKVTSGISVYFIRLFQFVTHCVTLPSEKELIAELNAELEQLNKKKLL